MTNSITQTIPVLDLRDFEAGRSLRSNFINQLGQALEITGFFALKNHDVEASLIHQAYQVTEAFFQQPEAIKLQYEDPKLNGQRGFTRFGREHAKDHPYPDLKEFWHVGRDLSADHALATQYPQNLVPIEVPDFHPVLWRLYTQLEICAMQLLCACALYLGESENLLADMVVDGDTILRVIHYPPIPAEAHPASVRSAPHEDINLITLLCEATDAGLELLQRDGSWLAISAVPGQIIVDSGDMLQQVTNGLFKSTTHRVVNPDNSRSRRFSMPFFVHPRSQVDLTPLASCIDRTGGVQKFPPITAGDYLLQRLREIGLAV
jgi:isopenicillin N synthase-like dioxygenase